MAAMPSNMQNPTSREQRVEKRLIVVVLFEGVDLLDVTGPP